MATISRIVPNSKPEHHVEEDRPVEIGLGEAVGRRIELFLVVRRLEAERIEIGVEMAAHAIGADQHERAHRIAGRPLDFGGGNFDAFGSAPAP